MFPLAVNSSLKSGKITAVANTPSRLSLGSGLLMLFTNGGQEFGMYGLDYWSGDIAKIYVPRHYQVSLRKSSPSYIVDLTSIETRTYYYVFFGE